MFIQLASATTTTTDDPLLWLSLLLLWFSLLLLPVCFVYSTPVWMLYTELCLIACMRVYRRNNDTLHYANSYTEVSLTCSLLYLFSLQRIQCTYSFRLCHYLFLLWNGKRNKNGVYYFRLRLNTFHIKINFLHHIFFLSGCGLKRALFAIMIRSGIHKFFNSSKWFRKIFLSGREKWR